MTAVKNEMLKELSSVLSLNNSMNSITLKEFAELVIADKKMNMPYIPMPEGSGFTAHFVKKDAVTFGVIFYVFYF